MNTMYPLLAQPLQALISLKKHLTRHPSRFAVGILLLSGALTGCAYENEAELFPRIEKSISPCGTDTVTYAKTIAPLLEQHCTTCHNELVLSGDVNLEGWAAVKAQADRGALVGAITGAPDYEPMPPGGAFLPNCDVERVKAWVQAGAPNN